MVKQDKEAMMKWVARSIIAALLSVIITGSLVILKGCGNQNIAPDGATITINPAEADFSTAWGFAIMEFSAVVRDRNRLPLNDIEVTVNGSFAYPYQPTTYILCRDPGGRNPVAAPFVGRTDKNGVYRFSLIAPSWTVHHVTTPFLAPLTEAPGLGSLAAGLTYSYRVSARDLVGATVASVPATITLTQAGGVNVNWMAEPGALSYDIYGRLPNQEQFLVNVLAPTTTWLDDGLLVPVGQPPAADTTDQSSIVPWGFETQIDVSSGTAFDQVDVKFNQ